MALVSQKSQRFEADFCEERQVAPGSWFFWNHPSKDTGSKSGRNCRIDSTWAG